jgi:hypothetical protein
MPKWYATFGWGTPLVGLYVVIEAEDRVAAHLEVDRRFPRWTGSITDELAWSSTNWQGHTHAQRLGLREITAVEEDHYRDKQSPD